MTRSIRYSGPRPHMRNQYTVYAFIFLLHKHGLDEMKYSTPGGVLSLSHSHSLSLTHTYTTHTLCWSLSLSYSLTHAYAHTPCLSLIHWPDVSVEFPGTASRVGPYF